MLLVVMDVVDVWLVVGGFVVDVNEVVIDGVDVVFG